MVMRLMTNAKVLFSLLRDRICWKPERGRWLALVRRLIEMKEEETRRRRRWKTEWEEEENRMLLMSSSLLRWRLKWKHLQQLRLRWLRRRRQRLQRLVEWPAP